MRGKTVVITGGTSAIGEVAAETLAKKWVFGLSWSHGIRAAVTQRSRGYSTVALLVLSLGEFDRNWSTLNCNCSSS
jgi:NAD(P)-dependent dehydrogenase (short-subunit alcohol dehydrogenase family)